MNNFDFKRLMGRRNIQKENDELKGLLSYIKSKLAHSINEIEEYHRKEYTSQYALFSLDDDGKYKIARIIDSDKEEEYSDDKMRDVVLIMRLPKSGSLKEFDGF